MTNPEWLKQAVCSAVSAIRPQFTAEPGEAQTSSPVPQPTSPPAHQLVASSCQPCQPPPPLRSLLPTKAPFIDIVSFVRSLILGLTLGLTAMNSIFNRRPEPEPEPVRNTSSDFNLFQIRLESTHFLSMLAMTQDPGSHDMTCDGGFLDPLRFFLLPHTYPSLTLYTSRRRKTTTIIINNNKRIALGRDERGTQSGLFSRVVSLVGTEYPTPSLTRDRNTYVLATSSERVEFLSRLRFVVLKRWVWWRARRALLNKHKNSQGRGRGR